MMHCCARACFVHVIDRQAQMEQVTGLWRLSWSSSLHIGFGVVISEIPGSIPDRPFRVQVFVVPYVMSIIYLSFSVQIEVGQQQRYLVLNLMTYAGNNDMIIVFSDLDDEVPGSTPGTTNEIFLIYLFKLCCALNSTN